MSDHQLTEQIIMKTNSLGHLNSVHKSQQNEDPYREDLVNMIERLGATVERQRKSLAELHAGVEICRSNTQRQEKNLRPVPAKPFLRLVKK